MGAVKKVSSGPAPAEGLEAEEAEHERQRRRCVPMFERGVGGEEDGVEAPQPLHLLPPVPEKAPSVGATSAAGQGRSAISGACWDGESPCLTTFSSAAMNVAWHAFRGTCRW
jgi:hypothetical protein